MLLPRAIPTHYRTDGNDIFAKAGVLNTGTGTGNISVTGLGFQPKIVFFWSVAYFGTTDENVVTGANDIRRTFGVALGVADKINVATGSEDAVGDSDTSKLFSVTAVVVAANGNAVTVEGILGFQSMDENGFTVSIDDAFPTNMRVMWLAIGGDIVADLGQFNSPGGGGGAQQYTGLGFSPTGVMLLTALIDGAPTVFVATSSFGIGAGDGVGGNFVMNGSAVDAQTTMVTDRLGHTERALDSFSSGGASVNQMLSDGFELLWNANTAGIDSFYAAVGRCKFKVGSFQTRTDTTPTQVTGVGFQPKAIIFLSNGGATATPPTGAAHDLMSIGFATESEQLSMAMLDRDNVGTSELVTAINTGNIYQNITLTAATATRIAEMQLVSMDSDGFTFVMTDVESVAALCGYIAFG